MDKRAPTSADKPKSDEPISTPTITAIGKVATRGAALTLSSQAGKIVIMMISTAVLARQLTHSDFGLVAMITSATSLLVTLRDGGLSTAAIQKPDLTNEQVSSLFWLNVGLGILFAAIVLALAPALAYFYGDPRLRLIAAVLSVNFVLGGLTSQHDALIRRALRFNTLVFIELTSPTLGAAVGIVMAYMTHSYMSLVFSAVTTAAARCAFVWLFSRWRPSKPSMAKGLRGLISFGGRYSLYNLIGTMAASADSILLGKYFGAEVLGLYNRAYALLLQPVSQIVGPMNTVAFPTLSRLAGDPVRFKAAMGKVLRLTSLASAFFCPFLLGGADWIVRLFLGPGWDPAVDIFRAFAVTAFSMPISAAATWILSTRGLSRELLRWGLMHCVLLVLAILCGLPWGALGVALAYSVSGLFVRVPILWLHLSKHGPLSFRDLTTLILPAFVLFMALTGCLFWFRAVFIEADPLVGLVKLGLAHTVVFCCALFCFRWGRESARLVVEAVEKSLGR